MAQYHHLAILFPLNYTGYLIEYRLNPQYWRDKIMFLRITLMLILMYFDHKKTKLMNYWNFLNLQTENELKLYAITKRQGKQFKTYFLVLISLCIAAILFFASEYFATLQ